MGSTDIELGLIERLKELKYYRDESMKRLMTLRASLA
jgi:hypothetical protein